MTSLSRDQRTALIGFQQAASLGEALYLMNVLAVQNQNYKLINQTFASTIEKTIIEKVNESIRLWNKKE